MPLLPSQPTAHHAALALIASTSLIGIVANAQAIAEPMAQTMAPAIEPAALTLREGTELSLTGRGPWIIEVGRRLWQLPAAGGRGTAVTANGQWARRPDLSPDGTRLTFQLLVGGAFQIATSQVDGTDLRVVTSGPWHHLTPTWSPDGNSIAFAANRTGRFQIWLLDLATSELRLTSGGGDEHYDPAWHRDSGRLVWVSDAPGRYGLHAQRPGGPVQRLLSSTSPLRAPAWRPDGLVLAYTALTPQGPRLQMAILSSPVVVKPLAPAEAATTAPPLWLDNQRLLYAADGQLRQREIGATISEPLAFEVELPPPPPAPAAPRITLPDPATPAAPLLVSAGRVLNATGDAWLIDHDILIEGGRIRAIAPRGTVTPPAGIVVLDASDRSVVPGLIDLSLQLPSGSSETLGSTLLRFGITTTQLRAGFGPTALDLAGRWQRLGSGPRALAGLAWCGGSAPAASAGILTVGVLRVCAAASDPLTLAFAPGAAERPLWSNVSLAAASGRVHAIEYPGTPLRVPLAEAQAGSALWYQDTLDQVLRSGIPVIATPAAALPAVFEFAPDLLDSPQVRSLCSDGPCPAAVAYSLAGPAARAALRDQRRILGRLAAGGGTVVAVSESPDTPYGLGLHAELRLLESAGLTRAAVLAAATRSAAAIAGLQEDIGTLAPGHLGDLLIVQGDPLADLRQLLAIDEVVLAGQPMGLATAR